MDTDTNMVIHVLPQENASPIVGVEIHVECIDFAVAAVIDNHCKTRSSVGLAGTIRLHTIKPSWTCGDIVIRCEIDALASLGIQRIEIVQGQRGWVAINDGEVDFWLGVVKLGSDITWEVCFARIEPYDRCCTNNQI